MRVGLFAIVVVFVLLALVLIADLFLLEVFVTPPCTLGQMTHILGWAYVLLMLCLLPVSVGMGWRAFLCACSVFALVALLGVFLDAQEDHRLAGWLVAVACIAIGGLAVVLSHFLLSMTLRSTRARLWCLSGRLWIHRVHAGALLCVLWLVYMASVLDAMASYPYPEILEGVLRITC